MGDERGEHVDTNWSQVAGAGPKFLRDGGLYEHALQTALKRQMEQFGKANAEEVFTLDGVLDAEKAAPDEAIRSCAHLIGVENAWTPFTKRTQLLEHDIGRMSGEAANYVCDGGEGETSYEELVDLDMPLGASFANDAPGQRAQIRTRTRGAILEPGFEIRQKPNQIGEFANISLLYSFITLSCTLMFFSRIYPGKILHSDFSDISWKNPTILFFGYIQEKCLCVYSYSFGIIVAIFLHGFTFSKKNPYPFLYTVLLFRLHS